MQEALGDAGSIPGSGRSPGGRKDYPLQLSGLENSHGLSVHGIAKSQTQLSDFHLRIKHFISHILLVFSKIGSLNIQQVTYFSH